MRASSRVVWPLALVSITRCSGPGASPDPGLDLKLRVQDAQLVPGPLPAASGGPEVTFLEVPQSRVKKGVAGAGVDGRLAPGGRAVHLQLAGDPDHWVRPAGTFDQTFLDELLWSAKLQFARTIDAGEAMVQVVAVDREGRAGSPVSARFALEADVSPGVQAVILEWDRQADLDLHVVLPDGTDVNPKNINSYQPPRPGAPPDAPDAWMAGARLDLDSNAGCVIDGVRKETIFWPSAPVPGSYQVFIDLFSACAVESVHFTVRVERNSGEVDASGIPTKRVIKEVDGALYDFDARLHPDPPGLGAPGLFVAEFEAE